MKEVKIPYIVWRDGKPRFVPGAKLRKMGFKGEDLKMPDGKWMTQRQAEDWYRALCRKIERASASGTRSAPAAPAQPMKASWYSLYALFKDWLGSSDVRDLKPASQKGYRYAAEVIEDDFPAAWHSDASALDSQICQGMYDHLRGGRGDHAAFNTIRALGVCIQWGIRNGKVSYAGNPAHKLKLKTPKPRVRAASIEEIDHLVATADKMRRYDIGDMILLGCFTGQRQADRLLMSMHSREGGSIHVRQGKTDVIIEVPELPVLTSRIDAAKQRHRELRVNTPLLVIDELNRVPFSGDHYRKVFADVRDAAAETMPSLAGFRDQDLRDTAVTWLARAGCTVPQICGVTGHSFASATAILKHYLAPHKDLATEAISKLQAWHTGDKVKKAMPDAGEKPQRKKRRTQP